MSSEHSEHVEGGSKVSEVNVPKVYQNPAPEAEQGEKVEAIQIENAAEQLNTIDFDLLSRQSIQFKSKATWRLIGVVVIQGISLSAFGVDYGVISGVVTLPQFQKYFDLQESGSKFGVIVAAIYIGNFVASLFVWLSDIIGRRGVTLLGCLVTILGGVIQVTAKHSGSLLVGRLFTGGGGALTATVAPMYMSELAPVCWRGLIVGLNASWGTIGGIVIAVILLGSSYLESDWSWRMPLFVQIIAPLIVAILVYPCTPESPRYLVSKGKIDEARRILARYHTTSEDEHCALVNAEITQIRESLALIQGKGWDFSPLYKTKTDRYRLFIIFLYSLFQQWNGSNLFSYYLPAVVSLVGITGSHQQLGLNLGQSAAGWVATLIGASYFDRVRRRTLLILAMSMFVLFLTLMTICSARFEVTKSKGVGYLIVVWVYLFDIFNGLTVVPMHSVYPNEVLHYRQRAKGMGMYSTFQAVFGVALTYGASALIAKIGWKIYFIFIGIDLAAIVFTYLFFPEFKNLSLEEIDLVFETPGTRPVKMANQLQKAKKDKRKQEITGEV